MPDYQPEPIQPYQPTPQDLDQVTRTILGEAADEPDWGKAAVAHVIRNRRETGKWGDTATDVVRAPWQFEPWWTRRRQLESYNPKSLAYQNAHSIAEDVFNGIIPDPTNGSTHFYSPAGQAHFGRAAPTWSRRSPMLAQIGGHRFYAPEGRVVPQQPDYLGMWNTDEPSAPQASPTQAAKPTIPDYLGMWDTGPDTALTVPRKANVGEEPTKKPEAKAEGEEHIGDTVARWVAEHPESNLESTLIKGGAGVLRGVGNIADTLAQGITGAGQYGAQAAAGAGVISPQSKESVDKWAERVNKDIGRQRKAWEKASEDQPIAKAGEIGGEILGTGPFVEALPLKGMRAAGPLARTVGTGTLTGGTAAGLTSSASDQPFAQQVAGGALAGGALSGVLGGAGKLASVTPGLKSLIGPSISPETARLAQEGYSRGINVGYGQMSEAPATRFLDSVIRRMPFSGYGKQTAEQQLGLNRAVANEMGVAANKVTQDVIEDARGQAYKAFDAEKDRMSGTLNVDAKLYGDLQGIHNTALAGLEKGPRKQVEEQLRNILERVDTTNPTNHTIPVENVQLLARHEGPLDKIINNKDSKIRDSANQIKQALDDLMVRNNPQLATLKKEADYKFAVSHAAEKISSPEGNISPRRILGTTLRGDSQYRKIGEVANRFMTEPPSSGTSERELLQRLLLGVGGGALGAGAYYDPENLQKELLAGGGGVGAALLAGAALRSPTLAKAAINRSLNKGGGKSLAELLSQVSALPQSPSLRQLLPPQVTIPRRAERDDTTENRK